MLRTVPLELDQPDPQPHLTRVMVVRGLTLLLFIGLLARLWLLEVVRYDQHERLASYNRVRLEPSEAPRGGIYDRHGELLAVNRIAHRVVILHLAPRDEIVPDAPALPGDVGPDAAVAQAALPEPTMDEQIDLLRTSLELTAEELERIRGELDDPVRPQFTPVVVRDDLTPEQLTRLEERAWLLPNVVIENAPIRSYPEAEGAAHVLGYVGSISPTELAAQQADEDERIREMERRIEAARRTLPDSQLEQLDQMTEDLAILRRWRRQMARTVGKTGVEQTYDEHLRGEPGILTWQVNARNEPVQLLSTTTGEAGNALYLNMDVRVQRAAAELLAGKRGAAVAIDPRNGGVLALYSNPSFDPNLFIPRIASEDWSRLLSDKAHPLLNRAVRSTYPPGSTFKGMVSSAAALHSGVVGPHTYVGCPGGMRVGRRFKRCWTVHGGTDLRKAIALSCDTWFYSAALKMGPQPIIDMAHAFGLGAPLGIDLPDERGGLIPDVADHEARWGREWYPGDTTNIVIGQGDVQTSALQIAAVTAAVANRGTLYRPQVVREVRSRDGSRVVKPWTPDPIRTIDIDREHIETIRNGMRAVVTEGTGRVANMPDIAVAGKTGSAEDPPRVLPHAWFVAFAPFDNPTIAICVVVENAGHGSTNAGPVARAMLDAWFAPRDAAGPAGDTEKGGEA